LAKNNQKKEKAERNKIYANKFRKRTRTGRFGRPSAAPGATGSADKKVVGA